jgi:hypothetical protein
MRERDVTRPAPDDSRDEFDRTTSETTEPATADGTDVDWPDRPTTAGLPEHGHRRVDPDVLRDGGPTRNRGVGTTTGGRRAGPASVRRRPRATGGRVAPTTTGDATSGGMATPRGGTTSDQSGRPRGAD